MQIDWWTLLLQAINFLVLVWLLWRFLYRPVREVVEKRKQIAEQALGEADRRKADAEAERKRYEEDRARLAGERQQLLKQAHADLENERQAALQQAQQQAEAMLQDARETIAKDRGEALAAIRAEVAETAAELAEEILRRTTAADPGSGLLDQLEQRYAALPAEERARLHRDIAADGGYVEVVTARDLTDDEKEIWRDRLAKRLGLGDRLRFATDAAVLGGAALHFPHAVLSLTWADQLRKAKDLLARDPREMETADEKAQDGDEAAS